MDLYKWRNKIFTKEIKEISAEGKLYPKQLTDKEMEPYNDQLQQIVDDHKIKNVAITGPYGIGKSSVLETFFRDGELEDKTVFINLPDFWNSEKKSNPETPSSKEENEDNSVIDEAVLQKKILEQIIFSTEKMGLLSRIGKAKAISFWIIFIFLVGVFLMMPKLVNLISDWNWDYAWLSSIFGWDGIVIGAVLLCLSYVIWKLINLIKVSRISVKILGQGIDFEEKNNLPFSKYAEELVMYFRYSNKKFVILEDLDRYEYTGIYKDLRDLNQLINRSLKGKDRVVFIYALRDTLILEKDEKSSVETKAKFFDYVVPILSNTSFDNGFETLNRELNNIFLGEMKQKVSLKELFDEKDLRILGYYLNGQRVIKLIAAETKQVLKRILLTSKANEGSIKEILKHEGIPAKEVLGSVIYKNFYPKEYEITKNHQSDIDMINASLQSIIVKMNAEAAKISKEIHELEDSIEEYKEVKDLSINDLKKNILITFLKSLKGRYVYFTVNHQWKKIDTQDLEASYKILDNNIDKINSNSITFYNTTNISDTSKIKTINKNELNKGNYKYSYEVFEGYETVGGKLTEWRHELEDLRKRHVFLKTQSDFSIVFSYIKEKDSSGKYRNVEQKLVDILIRIEEDRLKETLFTNGFVTNKFSNIMSSFENSKLSGNDRKIIVDTSLGNSIEFDRTVNDPKEVVNELKRIGIDFTLIDSYRIGKQLFNTEKGSPDLELIIINWVNKQCVDAAYQAFDEEDYEFVNHILKKWPDGLLDKQGNIKDVESFFSMIVQEEVNIELARKSYVKELNSKENQKVMSRFITKNTKEAKVLLSRLDGKIEFSNILHFDSSALQLMLEHDLAIPKLENIVKMVEVNVGQPFNFGKLGRFLNDFNTVPLVKQLIKGEVLYNLIRSINNTEEKILGPEESEDNLLILIDILQKNDEVDSQVLIMDLLRNVDLSELDLTLQKKKEFTERSKAYDIVKLDKIYSEDLSEILSDITHQHFLFYDDNLLEWFNLVNVETKSIILQEIFEQHASDLVEVEEILSKYIKDERIREIPEMIDTQSENGLNYILLKMYAKKGYFKHEKIEKIADDVIQYINKNNLKDPYLFINLMVFKAVDIEDRIHFTYRLIKEYDYKIDELAEHLGNEDEIAAILEEKKNKRSTYEYSDNVYIILKALNNADLTHYLEKEDNTITYQLKKDIKKHVKAY
jgi:hypothetical protein